VRLFSKKLGAVVLVSALLALAGLAAVVWTQLERASAPSAVEIGFARLDRPAPAVDLPSLTGRGSISLAALAGTPIVVNFWSSTCDICAAETRALVQVARGTRRRVTFLGIDTLDERGPAIAFVRRYQIPYQVAFDPTEVAGTRYGLQGLPETFFLSPDGHRILGVNIGALTAGSLMGILRRLYGTV
jgi:cytochrome c biogenesis protein CcmG, thiol:disulfide interchange protein DsbE